MKEKSKKIITNETVITFISGSAGELDWILPILHYLLNRGFNLKVIFLTRQARESVKKNQMLNDFICQKNRKVEVIFCGGYFFEKMEHFAYLSYRIYLKLNLGKYLILKKIYSFWDKLFESVFMFNLPFDILHLKNKKCLILSEFPSLRRPRCKWIKRKFNKSIFFYHPHSPHINAADLNQKYSEPDIIDLNKKNFLLLGHPLDYLNLNDGGELASNDLEKVFIGHPKYSNNWLNNLQEDTKKFHSTLDARSKINILVISRGPGSYFDEKTYKFLVETTIKAIHNLIPSYNLLVKKHPREINSYWDNLTSEYSSIKIIDDHILKIATESDFVISFWSSGVMDCYSLGVPTIEYYDPNKNPKQQISERGIYTTIYRKLGIVIPANTFKELEIIISDLLNRNYKMKLLEPHPFFGDLAIRSNLWDKIIKKILVTHNFIDN